MTPPSSRRNATLLLVLTTLFACCAQGQMFDVERERVPLSQLQGQWRFHLGDDADGKLGWASPGFDDSNWALLRSDESWAAQGYKNYSGFAWYRFKIMAPARGGSLAICIPRMRTSYQLFANGELIGQSGGLPPNQMDEIAFDQIFLIPGSGEKRGHPISMAIRVWNSAWTAGVAGGPDGAPYVGEISWIRDLKARDDWSRFWSMASGNVLMLMNLTAAFGGFFLFWMRPSDREYLWFGLYELLTGVEHLCSDWIMFYPTNANSNWLLDLMFSAASWLFFLLFVYRILNGRRNWLFWAAIGTEVAMVVATVSAIMDWIDLAQWRVAWAVILVPYFVCILSLLYRRARDRVPDAQMLLVPVALCYTSWFMMVVLLVFLALDQGWVARDFGWFFQLSRWPFPFSFQDVADMIMLLAVLAVLPLRFARSRRDEERLAGEMEAARTVQQVLIPTEISATPGVDVQCVYRPAGHVGGDFFQIIPLASGSTLVVIGDVSGKGMPAAMTVSLLIGTLRTLAHYTESPGEILDAMNRRMLARSQGGFTTCLVLKLAVDSQITVANAGHISPYLKGEELQVETGLPLGLAAESVYAESHFLLGQGEQLTLVTDGVVEARAKSGELLGFERTAGLSSQSAESIAEAAQAFGQDDDITVLTMVRTSFVLRPGQAMPDPVLSPS